MTPADRLPWRRRCPWRGTAFVLALASSGCAVGPNYHSPRVPVPPEFAATAASAHQGPAPGATSVALASWWQVLADPELASLIRRAVRANPNVLIALDRLQAARTYEAGLIGTLLPTAAASGAWGRGSGDDETRGRAGEPLVAADDTHGLTAVDAIGGFEAAWEIDIFGKFRREAEQARYNVQADADARNAVLVAVIADVARAYVDLRSLQMRAAILRAAVDVLQQSLRIVTERYQRGITNELDVTLAQRELGTFQAQLAPIEAQVSDAQYTLATLVGLYPEDLTQELGRPGMIPEVPSSVQAGLPLDLLRRRPDILEAERQIASANAQIGIDTANLFPQFILTGAIGEQQGRLGTSSISQHIWSLGPGAVWPLLDFGQLDAQVQIASLRTRAALVNYKAQIQTAVQQVDAAVDGFTADQTSLRSLGSALVASQRAVTLANARYNRGLTDFLNVVDAEREQYTIEDQYIATQASLDQQFVALYRALGGGWQSYQDIPDIVKPLPAIVAIFRDTLGRGDPLKDP